MACFFNRLRHDRALLPFVLSAFFALLACILRTVAFFIRFDVAVGYFRSDSFLVILANLCMLFGIAASLATSFLINKGAHPAETRKLPLPRFVCAAVCAILLCILSSFLLIRTDNIPAPQLLVLISTLILPCSAFYFLLRLLNDKSNAAVALGFFTILSAAAILAITYFDRYTPMNAPHKLSLHVCMLSVMFGMLYELRALLSRPMPRACVCVTMLAAFFCTVYSVSNLIAFFGGVYDDVTYLFFDLVTLSFAAYFAVKAVYLIFTKEKEEKKEEEAQ